MATNFCFTEAAINARLERNGERHLLSIKLKAQERSDLEWSAARLGAIVDELQLILEEAMRQRGQFDLLIGIAVRLIEVLPGKVRSQSAREKARTRHESDPKQKDKAFVYGCWKTWRMTPYAYKSNAAFARDMMDKVGVDNGGTLESADTIAKKWIPTWKLIETSK